MNKIKKFLLIIYLSLNILFILIGSYLYTTKIINYSFFSHLYKIPLIINLAILIGIFVYIIVKKRYKLNAIDIILLMMVIFSVISVIYAKNKNVALNGAYGRYEGFYQIMYYYSLFLLSTFINQKNKKIIVYLVLFFGFVQLIYALLQVGNIGNVFRVEHDDRIWALGFTSNPSFFATIMLLCLSISLGLFIDTSKNTYKLIYGLLIFMFMIGLLISNTMSCIIGLIIVLIYIFIYLIKKKYFVDILCILIIIIFSFLIIIKSDKTTIGYDIVKTTNEAKEIVSGNVDDSYGTKRIFIWRKTLRVVPKNIMYGVGIDNFFYAFGDEPLQRGRYFYDKAHNEYLQILITEGIFALISYLIFYGIIVIRGIKNNYKRKEIYLILPILGYLVQAFFNISVIEVAPLFYILLGLCIDRKCIIDK